ncbi:hypothetical protein BDV59DRAFT_169724 [Aspergillus ambiguus]|uniref:uncharacterized protein n=1 Tax=Aspergillus ambiguus TaxID=176160 RepID=UPI003CCC9904
MIIRKKKGILSQKGIQRPALRKCHATHINRRFAVNRTSFSQIIVKHGSRLFCQDLSGIHLGGVECAFHGCDRIQPRIVGRDGSLSSQWRARTSAARRSETTYWSVNCEISWRRVLLIALSWAVCCGPGRAPRRIFPRCIAHRLAAAARR